MNGVFKTSFYIMFNPGSPELLGPVDDTKRLFALTMWATFQVRSRTTNIPYLETNNEGDYRHNLDKSLHWPP